MDTLFQERVLDKLESLSTEVTDIKVHLAALPTWYVSRTEVEEAKKEAKSAKRWAISLGSTTLLGIGMLLINVFNVF